MAGRAQTMDHLSFGQRCNFLLVNLVLTNSFFLRLDDEERIYLGLFYYSYYNNDLLTAVLDADDDDDDGTAPLPSLISEYREVDAGEQNLRYA